MQNAMSPQYRICFTVFKQCERCKGRGYSLIDDDGSGIKCPSCNGYKGKNVVQVLSIKREYELQQQALRRQSKKKARRVG